MLPNEIREAVKSIPGFGNSGLFSPIGGGCINNGGKFVAGTNAVFLKWNDRKKYPGMFAKEKEGLNLLTGKSDLKIPGVIAEGETARFQYLVLEFVEPGAKTHDFWSALGRSLALLHRTPAMQFGLDHDNYIGSLRQSNRFHSSWTDFFWEERLAPQLKLATDSGIVDRSSSQKFGKLSGKLHQLFPEEKPALLHGDLWSGNLLVDRAGTPALIDPAVYYGHREAELAFTTLFGGFDEGFYSEYENEFPLQPGFENRKDVYNLYPLLIHTNLFGGGYFHQALQIAARFV